MRLRPIILSPLLRWCAAVTLVAWVGAQALCQAHCMSGGCNDESDDLACRTTAAAAPHHAEDDHGSQPCHHDQGADASCTTLKSVLVGNGASPIFTPQFLQLFTLPPFALTLDARCVEASAIFSRQARPSDWVFTPEVCLGPALRSHAPPFSSLT